MRLSEVSWRHFLSSVTDWQLVDSPWARIKTFGMSSRGSTPLRSVIENLMTMKVKPLTEWPLGERRGVVCEALLLSIFLGVVSSVGIVLGDSDRGKSSMKVGGDVWYKSTTSPGSSASFPISINSFKLSFTLWMLMAVRSLDTGSITSPWGCPVPDDVGP